MISSRSLCGTTSQTNPSPSAGFVGMLSTQVEISTEKSLQQGIDDGSIAKVDGGWSSWSGWGGCSVTACGQTGTQEKTRTCTNPAPFCGGAACPGSNTDTQSCSTAPCPVIPDFYGSWTNTAVCQNVPSDTCNNNKNDPYTCLDGAAKICTDRDLLSSSTQVYGCPPGTAGGAPFFQYRYRSILCIP